MPPRVRTALAGAPVDADLRAPHPALLVSWALAFIALVAGFAAVTRSDSATPTAAVALAVVTGIAAAVLGARRVRTLPVALVGLVLLDLAPPLLQLTADSAAGERGRVVLLIPPTMIAAASLTRHFFRGQIVVAAGLAALMLGFTADDRTTGERLAEIALVVATLVSASIMVRGVSAATAAHIAALRTLALTDKLTGVRNRRGLADEFDRLRTDRRQAIGVISLDIDHFKWFNDTYGHAEGDEILRLVCAVLTETAGPGAIVARTGGEELVAIVPGPARPVAEEFRARLATAREPRVTVSVGVLDVTADAYDEPAALWRILDAADHAMYQAKSTGRDRICRGTLDPAGPFTPPLVPVPQQAAVPQPADETRSTMGSLPGWILAAFGAGGIAAGFVRDTGPQTGTIGQLYMTIMALCLIAGVIIIGMGPLMDRFRWVAGIVGSDIAILFLAISLPDGAARMVAVVPSLLTGLMVAQHFARRWLVGHHLAVVALCMTAPVLAPGPVTITLSLLTAAVLIGATELIFFLQARHRAAGADLHRWSVTDPLTGLANRHGLELGFEALSRAQQLTVLALDVDDFKGINDTYGHAAGDDALIRLAATLRTVTSADTVVCRTGGDEFVVLAPSMRPSALTSVVKRAAALLPLPLSVSVGSAVAAPHRLRSLWQLVDAADAALIRAKRSRTGRRRGTGPEAATALVEPATALVEPATALVEPATALVNERVGVDDDAHPPTSAHAAGDWATLDLAIDSDDGSFADTSTTTRSPSTNAPDRSWRAS